MDLKILNENVWSMLFLPLFGCCGISLLFRCRFLPFRRFGVMLHSAILGRDEKGRGLTPFQAASTALAATVGTGNIIGTAQAVAMGGPGAVFWLWAAALLGMTIKYAEILQGLRFQNGAMGYISAALGRFPAGVYALLAAVSALTVGNMAQMNGAVQALCRVMGHEEMSLRLILGVVLTAMIGLGIRGGAGHVGRLMERLIPMMTLSYLILTGAAIFAFRARLPGVLLRIASEAFHPRAVLGAAGGIGLRQTILWGLRRGSFSNEAGLGTAANIHAFAESEKPAIHALWGYLGGVYCHGAGDPLQRRARTVWGTAGGGAFGEGAGIDAWKSRGRDLCCPCPASLWPEHGDRLLCQREALRGMAGSGEERRSISLCISGMCAVGLSAANGADLACG